MSGRSELGCAIVTGASRGFGFGIAKAFALAGHSVVMAARDGDALERAAAHLDGCEGTAVAHAADVTSPHEARELVETALERFGHVDVLVNNAGASPVLQRLEAGMTWDEWRTNVDVDVRAMFNTSQLLAPLLRRRGAGTIVNVASGAVIATSPLHVSYTPAQLAIVGFSQCLGSDLAGSGVAVHCLCPTISLAGGVGKSAIETFASARGVTPEEWLLVAGPGSPTTEESIGSAVLELAAEPVGGVWHVDGEGFERWHLLTPPPAVRADPAAGVDGRGVASER